MQVESVAANRKPLELLLTAGNKTTTDRYNNYYDQFRCRLHVACGNGSRNWGGAAPTPTTQTHEAHTHVTSCTDTLNSLQIRLYISSASDLITCVLLLLLLLLYLWPAAVQTFSFPFGTGVLFAYPTAGPENIVIIIIKSRKCHKNQKTKQAPMRNASALHSDLLGN